MFIDNVDSSVCATFCAAADVGESVELRWMAAVAFGVLHNRQHHHQMIVVFVVILCIVGI